METVADKLLQKLTTKAKADEHLYIRGEVNGNQMHATSVDELRSDNAKNKKAIVKLNILDELKSDGTKTNKKKLMSHSVYGYMIKMPETFNGTIIQQIELTTTAWTVVDPTKAIKSSRSSVEAFYLKKGATDLDLHTANRSFDPAIVKKAEFVYKMKIGAGTYNGEGVTEFKILEKNDKSNKIAGLVNFTGATKEITVTITIDSEGNKSITGPWTE